MATQYVILKQNTEASSTDEGRFKSWSEIGAAEAGGDLAAIKEFLSQGDNGEAYGEGNYRAVPKRSWAEEAHPIKRKISFG